MQWIFSIKGKEIGKIVILDSCIFDECTLPKIKVALLSFFRAILFFSFSVLLLSVFIFSRFLLTDLTGTFPMSIISLASLLNLNGQIC